MPFLTHASFTRNRVSMLSVASRTTSAPSTSLSMFVWFTSATMPLILTSELIFFRYASATLAFGLPTSCSEKSACL
ncbi:MAG: hypothetical protein A3K75_04065 [Euryarchaeota archaeon RBG_13_61_15]|nr:MAG: hypothetical protein A3K75_04065 [Euryarchaeota archaeon RBG_13_61_15]